MSGDDLIRLSAREVVSRLRSREISPLDLLDAATARIEALDGTINALPIRCFERAREQARRIADAPPADSPHNLLGSPIAVKDYNDVAGVRTTYGSPIYANHVAKESDATVARLERNGAIPIAKSNVPEWAGGHTFNPVHGVTRNPWGTNFSVGGSSGGSAAALAAGMVWLATGNDLGGSLRTPAGFNGVVGLRPSPGRVPRGGRLLPFDPLWVEGPMARNVGDVALMLDAGKGHDPMDPLSFDGESRSFLSELEGTGLPRRVAFSPDLGIVPVAREISDLCRAGAERFSEIGARVTYDVPDFGGALEAFHTLRAVLFGAMMGPVLDQHRDEIAPEIVWNIEKGLDLTAGQVLEAERVRQALFQRMTAFFETHDLLICPAASIEPFPVELRYVESIDGNPCESYIDWFAITFALTLTSCPIVVIPCGFTANGLPVGIQIVGRPRGEAELLRAAHRMEEVFGISHRLPVNPS